MDIRLINALKEVTTEEEAEALFSIAHVYDISLKRKYIKKALEYDEEDIKRFFLIDSLP